MKRIKTTVFIALLLSVVLVLAGCGSTAKEQTAYELVKSAAEKTNALDSSEMNMEINMKMSIMGMTMDLPMKYNIKTAKDGDAVNTLGTMDMSVMGESFKAEMFIDKDFIYMKEIDTDDPDSAAKVKIPVDDETAKAYNVADMSGNMIKTLPEDILKDVEVVKSENGDRIVNVQIAEDRFNEIFKEYTDSALSNVLSEISDNSDTEIKFSNTKVTVTVDKNGYISKYDLGFDISLKMDMQGISMDLNATCESFINFVDPGTKVVVEKPADLDTYEAI